MKSNKPKVEMFDAKRWADKKTPNIGRRAVKMYYAKKWESPKIFIKAR